MKPFLPRGVAEMEQEKLVGEVRGQRLFLGYDLLEDGEGGRRRGRGRRRGGFTRQGAPRKKILVVDGDGDFESRIGRHREKRAPKIRAR